MKVPVSTPDITSDDRRMVAKCLRSGWVSGISPYVEKFENAYAEYIGVPHALTTNSGTTALHLACATTYIGQGDEVIMPTFTMIASANAVNYCGGKPVFVDCKPDTWCIDPEKIEAKITPRTVAIMPVHIYGHPCDMKAITEIAQEHDLIIIEDAAESHGAEIKGIGKTGSIGDIGCFSLYANKIITTGEGGILTFKLKKDYERAHWLRAHAFGRKGRHYWHDAVGYGYRMSGLQAALGLSQLKRIDQYIEHRRLMAKRYMKKLGYLRRKGYIDFPVEKKGAENVYWMFSLLVNPSSPIDRDELMDILAKKEVETRTFFYPLHVQPPYKQHAIYPESECIANMGLNLPSGNQLTEEQVDYVCDCIKKAMK